MKIKEQIRHYLEERLSNDHKGMQLTDTTMLLEQKVIDSIGMLELVFFLQDSFGIEVPEEDITPENFDTIQHLVTYVESKRTTVIS